MSKVRSRSDSISNESARKRQKALTFADATLEDDKLTKRVRKTVDDPNLVLISKSTPRKQLLSYVLDRLADGENTSETRNVVLLASNSAMQSCISIAEIVKRRFPDAVYRVDIGTTYADGEGAGRAYAIRIEFQVK